MEVALLDYGPVVLRIPFGFRLAADTLPSGCPDGQNPTVGASPWLYPSFPTSGPFRVRHGHVSQPTRYYPRLWIRRPSFERPRDLNPPDQNTAQHTLRPPPTPDLADGRLWFPVSRCFAKRITKPGLSGSWLIFRRPLSRITPEDSAAALARCLTDDIRLHHIRKTGHPHWCNEAERVRLRYG
jgi:hypothetical protein